MDQKESELRNNQVTLQNLSSKIAELSKESQNLKDGNKALNAELSKCVDEKNKILKPLESCEQKPNQLETVKIFNYDLEMKKSALGQLIILNNITRDLNSMASYRSELSRIMMYDYRIDSYLYILGTSTPNTTNVTSSESSVEEARKLATFYDNFKNNMIRDMRNGRYSSYQDAKLILINLISMTASLNIVARNYKEAISNYELVLKYLSE